MCLLTNNPKKIVGLEGYDMEVTSRQSIEVGAVPENLEYLRCKKDKMGHLLDLSEATDIKIK
jgi:3,4-dihydroxy 2-butanone 4-phosphate synthase / GTP cyclohydrolase II